MSFIIKGIDLPKDGKTLRLEIFDDGSIMNDRGVEWQGFPRGTAIQIPKGHGRLIDGDELNKSVHNWNPVYTYGRSAFTREVDNAPTILEAEEE